LAVKSLEIVTYDEATATPHQFKVAVSQRGWSLPSRFDYPADAKDQVAEAASGLMNLKVMEVASDSVADHKEYGLVDPTEKNLSAGATGVGTRVTMKDGGGKVLLDLIIGKQVPGKTDLRYVRRVGQDQAFTTAAKIDRLSTKFEDWIEKNLLKFNKFDLKQVELADYQVDLDLGTISPRGEITAVNNDPNEPKWLIGANKVFDPRSKQGIQFIEKKLADDQEANAEVLDKLTTALDDLKIVDVAKKPTGLTADLRTNEDFAKNAESRKSLMDCGFAIVPLEGKRQIFSNQGEVRVVMKTGVEYILRFGAIAAGTGGGSSAKEQAKDKPKDSKDAKDDKKEEKKDASGSNRYLFITAEFRADALPKPELEKLPELPKEEKKEEPKKDDAKKAEAKKDDAKKDESKKPAEKAGDKKDAPADAKKDEKKPEEIKAERDRIEKENKRKQEEFDKKVEDGKKEVKELNDRFAEWYYVISDDVFRKIRVNREELIRKKEKKEEKTDAADKKGDDDHAGHDHAKPAAEKPKPNTPADFQQLKEAAPAKK
jgi:hypothetical protein